MDAEKRKQIEAKLRAMFELSKQNQVKQNQVKQKQVQAKSVTGTVIRRRKGVPDKRIL